MMAAAALADIVATQSVEQWATALDDWGTAHVRPWFEEHIVADAWLRETWARQADRPRVADPVERRGSPLRPPTRSGCGSSGPFLGMAAGPESIDPLREQVRGMLRAGWRPARPGGITRDELVAVIEEVCVPV